MELDTKITFLGLMIPELYLFLILAILGGGHIEYGQKMPSRFFLPGILIDLVNKPPKGNNYEGFKTIPIFSRSNPIFMRLHRLACRWNHCNFTPRNGSIVMLREKSQSFDSWAGFNAKRDFRKLQFSDIFRFAVRIVWASTILVIYIVYTVRVDKRVSC